VSLVGPQTRCGSDDEGEKYPSPCQELKSDRKMLKYNIECRYMRKLKEYCSMTSTNYRVPWLILINLLRKILKEFDTCRSVTIRVYM